MCAMPGRNPYRPGVGIPPMRFAGRERELRRFASVLRAAPEIPANVRLTGLRGVGKTVLLGKLGETAEHEGWVSAALEVEPRHNTEASLSAALDGVCAELRRQLSRAVRTRERLGKAARSVRGVRVGYQDITVSLEAGWHPAAASLVKSLGESVDAAHDAGHAGMVLLLDEAQVLKDERARDGEHPLSLLLATCAALQRAEAPLAVVLCGLPTLTTNLLEARTYSERMFRGEHIGSLDADASREAFVDPLEGTGVSVEDGLVDAVLAAVEGYPYFIQLWGAELWDAADHADVQHLGLALLEEVEVDIYRRLDLDFYEPRVQALTPAEQDVLLASGQVSYPPLRVADLNAVSDKTPANVNVLLGRLVNAGVLYRIRKGQYEYTAPKFSEFLRRRTAGRAR